MPLYTAQLNDGTTVQLEADAPPSEEDILGAIPKQADLPKVSAPRTFFEHAATGVVPGAGFMAAFPAGARVGAGIGALIPGAGETGISEAIGAGIGGLITGSIGAYAAHKLQKKALETVAPEFEKRLETEMAAGEQQHPIASSLGEIASLGPSAKMAPFKLAQIPLRAAIGAGVSAGMPLLHGEKPTARDVLTGAAMATIYGEARWKRPTTFQQYVDTLRPAVKTMDGTLHPGERGQTHNDIIEKMGISADDLDRRTFIDANGKEVPRQIVARLIGTERPGEAHSTDLNVAQERIEDASKVKEAAAVHGDVRPQPVEGEGRVPAEKGGGRILPPAEAEATEVLLRPHLEENRQQGLGSSVRILESFPNDPEHLRIAQAHPPEVDAEGNFVRPGVIDISKAALDLHLADTPEALRAEVLRTNIAEEGIHSIITPDEARAYEASLTSAERKLGTKVYLGKLKAEQVGLTPTWRAHELLRQRMQQLMRLDTTEASEVSGVERWGRESLMAISNIIRRVREFLGTKAATAGRALTEKLLDRAESNIRAIFQKGAARPVEEPAPAAIRRKGIMGQVEDEQVFGKRVEDVTGALHGELGFRGRDTFRFDQDNNRVLWSMDPGKANKDAVSNFLARQGFEDVSHKVLSDAEMGRFFGLPMSIRRAGQTSVEEVEKMSNAEAVKFFNDMRAAGIPPQHDSPIAGLKLGPEDVPRLQALRDKAAKDMMSAFRSGDKDAQLAAFGKNIWYSGVIEGAQRRGANYAEAIAREGRAGVEPAGEAVGAAVRGEPVAEPEVLGARGVPELRVDTPAGPMLVRENASVENPIGSGSGTAEDIARDQAFAKSIRRDYRKKLREEIAMGSANAPLYEAALAIQDRLDQNKLFWRINEDMTWLQKNGDYWKSVDPDSLCQKSEGTDAAVNYLKQVLGDKYESSMAWEVIGRANGQKLKTPCPQCYVFSHRAAGAMAKVYLIGVAGYNGEVTRFKDTQVEDLVNRALRHYSSTDFKAEHIPGLIIETIQMSERGLPAGAYSKDGDFPRVFAPARYHINMSVGRNEVIGMPMAEALALREQYPTVGTVYVGFNDAEILSIIGRDNIDHIIPWHGSAQKLTELAGKLGVDPSEIFNYEKYKYKGISGNYQRDTINGEMAKQQLRDADHGGDMDRYLWLIKQGGMTPRFPQLLDALKAEGRPELYMKLIGPEYGKHGGPYPYEPVQPVFDFAAVDVAMRNRLKNRLASSRDYIRIAQGIAKEVNDGSFVRGPVKPLIQTGAIEPEAPASIRRPAREVPDSFEPGELSGAIQRVEDQLPAGVRRPQPKKRFRPITDEGLVAHSATVLDSTVKDLTKKYNADPATLLKTPTFEAYAGQMRKQFGELPTGALIDRFEAGVWDMVMKASGKELEALRSALTLRTKVGSREIADAPPEKPAPEPEAIGREAKLLAQDKRKAIAAAQKYRRTVQGAIGEKMISQAVESFRPALRTTVTPEDLGTRRKSKQPVYYPVEPKELEDVNALGNKLTDDAGQNKLKRSITKRLTVVENPTTKEVAVVSTFRDPRRGPVLLDPNSPEKTHLPLPELMKVWKPIHSIFLDEPVERFLQRFKNREEYETKLGKPIEKMKAAWEEPVTEGAQPAPSIVDPHRPLMPEEAAGIMDHLVMETGKVETIDDVHDAIAGLRDATVSGKMDMDKWRAINGLLKVNDALAKRWPILTEDQVFDQMVDEIHDKAIKSTDVNDFVSKVMGDYAPEHVEDLQRYQKRAAETTEPEKPRIGRGDYSAGFLTPPSREALAKAFPGIHPNKFGEHITVQYEPKQTPGGMGKFRQVEVVGYAADSKAEAVVVRGLESANKVPHITISTAEGVKPAYSNQLLSDPANVKPVDPPIPLTVAVGMKVGGKTILDPTAIQTGVELETPGRNVPFRRIERRLAVPQPRFPEPARLPARLTPVEQTAVMAEALRKHPPAARPLPEMEPAGGSEPEPASLRRAAAIARDEIENVGLKMAGMLRSADVTQQVSAGKDIVDNASNNIARSAEVEIRLESMQRPAGAVVSRLRGAWRQGNKNVLAAANVLVESGFDPNKISDFRAELAQGRATAEAWESSTSGRRRREGRAWLRALDEADRELDYAQAHWNDPELQATARKAQQILDESLNQELAAGMDINRDPNYMPHRYAMLYRSGVMGKRYKLPQTFDTYYKALSKGPYLSVTRDAASLVGHRVRQGQQVIAENLWKESLKSINYDGKPLAIEPVMKDHVWHSPDLNYTLVAQGGGVKPLAVLNEFETLFHRLTSHSSINDWAMTRGALHLSQRLKHTLLLGDFFHLARVLYYGASIMRQNVGFRGGWTVLDVPERAIPLAVRKGLIRQADADWGAQRLTFTDPTGRTTTMTRRDLAKKFYTEIGANLGKIQDALYKELVTNLTPRSGSLARGIVRVTEPTIGRYNRFLFDTLTRGLMTESAVREFERQAAKLTTRVETWDPATRSFQQQTRMKVDPTRLMRDVAKDVNVFFGNIGRQGFLKAKWEQDLARMFFLAPQWVEGLLRKEITAYSRMSGVSQLLGRRGLAPLGTTGRGIATGMVFLFGLTQAINYIMRGHSTFSNPEEGHKADAYIPGWGSDNRGFWLSPLAIYNELTHDVYRLLYSKPHFMQAFGQIMGNKESPLLRAALVLKTGQGPTGEIQTTGTGVLKSAAEQLLPVPITFGKYGQQALHMAAPGVVKKVPAAQLQRQAFGTFGIKVEPMATPSQRVSEMARDFMKREGLDKETGWQEVMNDEASYSKLRASIRIDDIAGAKKIYNRLLKGRSEPEIVKAMKTWAKRGFTGSAKTERLFLDSLDEEQMNEYSNALDQKLELYEKFLDFYNDL